MLGCGEAAHVGAISASISSPDPVRLRRQPQEGHLPKHPIPSDSSQARQELGEVNRDIA